MARILVVDDEPDVRELFNITLKMAGHVTDTAKDGQEAVEKLESDGDPPDLILLDLMMPRLDGFGLLSHIRSEMDSKPCRVLVATAKVLEDADREKLNSWPVVGVLNKGELDIGQMVVIVSSALSKDPNKAASNGSGSGAESKAEADSKAKADTKTEASTGAQPEAKAGSETESKTQAKTGAEAKVETDAKGGSEKKQTGTTGT